MSLRIYSTMFLLAGLLGCSPLIDETLIEVRIVSVWTEKDLANTCNDSWGLMLNPHTVVERLDTRERKRMLGITWGTTGEVFVIRKCDLTW